MDLSNKLPVLPWGSRHRLMVSIWAATTRGERKTRS